MLLSEPFCARVRQVASSHSKAAEESSHACRTHFDDMVAHRLQIWLDEHGLADLSHILAEVGIDSLEDLTGLEKDDLTSLGIPEGYVNRLRQSLGRDVSGRLSIWESETASLWESSHRSDPQSPRSPWTPGTPHTPGTPSTPGEFEFAQLARPGAASGRARPRGRGRGRGRSRPRDEVSPTIPEDHATAAAESPSSRFKGCSKLEAFLMAAGLQELLEPLKDIGIEMYDDLLEFSQASSPRSRRISLSSPRLIAAAPRPIPPALRESFRRTLRA